MSDKERAFEEQIPGGRYSPQPGGRYSPQPGGRYSPQPGMPPAGTRPPVASMNSLGPQLGPSSMDPYNTMTGEGQEGYDYQFEPNLDTKYECPICLMCLREPVQTKCGHRFCRNCITRSLRDAGRRCPIDNTPLTEQRFFPDVCVKREILDLQAHCPYKDCPDIVELRNMDQHQEDCRFGTLICPQKCGHVLRRKSIETHICTQCPKRRVLCDHCSVAVPLDELQVHMDVCTRAPTQCSHCGEAMLRDNLNPHVKTNCPAVMVDCRYRSVGCMQRLERNLMAEHLQTEMQLHMDLLASKLDQMNIPGATPTPLYSQYNPVTDAALADYGGDYSHAANANPATAYPKESPYTRGNGPSQQDTIAIEKYGAQTLDQNMLEKTHTAKYMSGSMMGSSMSGKIAGLQRHSSNLSDLGDANVEMDVSQLKERVQHLQRNIAQQNQDILMLKANAERGQQDTKKVKELTESFNALESRLCNGEFYWRLMGYSGMVREAQRGETSVRHSKGFYTSFYGYKLCLRVNINVSESSHNSHVSLFVHFLKGDYDDLLDWPFSGKITLTIMDQNADSSKRKHISETLLSKPDLAAFHRPRTHRNHKGFGYMEFAPVNMLDAGTFIKDDCLLIRVLVEVKKT